MKAGDILYHKNFTFPDGGKSAKLLILLNTPNNNDPYLLCIVTSKQKFRSKNYGCNPDKEYFYLPASHDWFDLETWILLDTLTGWTADSILKDRFNGELTVIDEMKSITVRELKNCVKRITTISNYYKRLIIYN